MREAPLMKLADFGNVSFNFARTDPSFHALADRFGNQTTRPGMYVIRARHASSATMYGQSSFASGHSGTWLMLDTA